MMDIWSEAPFSACRENKEDYLKERLLELTERHRRQCPEYGRMLDGFSFDADKCSSLSEIPFLPVRLFKEMELRSVPKEEVVKTMTSSGTTGQRVSKIFLDRATAAAQQKAMVRIVSDFTGSSRMPMIILDSPSVIKDRRLFSARGAGILGFSIFGSKKLYALNDEMKLDEDALRAFLEEHKGKKLLLFGFTFMVWQHFYKELCRLKDKGVKFDLSNAVLIHGGGWKKLQSEAVGREEFHRRLQEVCGLSEIHDYYGMVEQTGSIYMECECGHLHASAFSDIIMRNPADFRECGIGERGIIQTLSVLPESYPGHSLITEDEGVLLGVDDCPCGRKGKYFRVLGRLKDVEIRGCSDTYGAGFEGKLPGAGGGFARAAENSLPRKSSGIGGGFAGSADIFLPRKSLGAREEDAFTVLAGFRASGGEIRISGEKDQASENALNVPFQDSQGKSSVAEQEHSVSEYQPCDFEKLPKLPFVPALEPFNERVCAYLNETSRLLMQDKEAKRYPDVITFAFWIRAGSIASLKRRFLKEDGMIRLGRGTVFHIAPSNVPVNFAFSLAAGLLTGNRNIVRVPSKAFPQVDIISEALEKALKEYEDIRPYICLIHYGRDRKLNDVLSSVADTRIIWGGDQTIREIRESSLPPRSTEICFADRFSIAVIDCEAYLSLDERGREGMTAGFYNDTYLTDQNACSSPRLIAWLGGRREEAKADFWDRLRRIVARKYVFQDVQGIDKLSAAAMAVVGMPGCRIEDRTDNLLYRLKIPEIREDLQDCMGNSGFFLEYDCGDIMELLPLCSGRLQTIAFLGNSERIEPLLHAGTRGIDRVVPFGNTMDFDMLWDGYNLFSALSRVIYMGKNFAGTAR